MAQKVFNLILKFANYGFNKSHSVAYAYVGYQMCFLKTHYPIYFYTALLNFNIGSETRQIVSGIAKFYNPDDLVGKKVVVVKNLKPITLRGETSHGMLMCAFDKNDKDLELLNVTKLNAGDLIG